MDELTQIATPEDLAAYVASHPEFGTTATVERLHAEIVAGIVVNRERARRLAALARWLAERLGDQYALGLADRSEGHLRYATADYSGAVTCYETAADRFDRIGRESDVAKTLLGSMQSLIYLGRDEQALQFAKRARLILERESDHLRLARLDSNVGNILYRQGKYAEAREYYRKARDTLVALNRPQDVAAVLANMAVASTGLGDFDSATREYGESRRIADREGLSALAAETDYNIAHLYFLRGDHTRALELYREARRHSDSIGDGYHSALCDLDTAEVYLDLNLIDESIQLAHAAALAFERLGMQHEQARALTFQSIGEQRRSRTSQALLLLNRARDLFKSARNTVWCAMTDLYRANLLQQIGQKRTALKFVRRARTVFQSEGLPGRRALADLLIAQIQFDENLLDQAALSVNRACDGLISTDHPMTSFYAEFLLGRICAARGDSRRAYSAFIRATDFLESIRCRLSGGELKVAFLRDKLRVYEELMLLAPQVAPEKEAAAMMFDFIEHSKSRSLADRLAAISLPDAPCSATSTDEFVKIRQELNALYREMDLRQLERRDETAARQSAARLERRMKFLLTESSIDERAVPGLAEWNPVRLDDLAAALPHRSQLIEYYIARQRLWVCVIGKTSTTFKDLGPFEPVLARLRLLKFQLLQARHGLTQVGRRATQDHLQALYAALIAPIERWLGAEDLIIAPHGFLHELPFQALHDGSSCLIDRSNISYVPGATVFMLCERYAVKSPEQSLLIGVPDATNPAVEEEVEAISALLPNPRVIMRHDATQQALLEHAANSRFIHIAAHAEFRSDNPLFSCIRLGDSRLSVLDFYRLKLNADLVTLSGCSTGAGVVVGGDELVSLARAVIYAGARSVLLTLWDVHDSSTAQFMKKFYRALVDGNSYAAALRQASLQLRQDWPDPFYWAPFVITGYALSGMTDVKSQRPYIFSEK
jgi:CHAT domain-containing protein